MQNIKITFGDFYNDGHGMYETFDLKCNRSPGSLAALEPLAEVFSGYRFQTNGDNRMLPAICNEYEDGNIPDKVVADLVAKGFDNILKITYNGKTEEHPLHELEDGVRDFAEFFMRWLKLVDPDLEWKWPSGPEKVPHAVFNCRGYGLFS